MPIGNKNGREKIYDRRKVTNEEIKVDETINIELEKGMNIDPCK